MKKRIGITAAAISASCLMILSGCAGCASCNGTSKNLAALNSNWYANTSYKKIQPTFTEGNDLFHKEELTYKVKFDSSSAGNATYSVSYADGTYKTEFYAAQFDKNLYCADEFKGAFPDKLVAYCYKTELNIPSVTFTYGEESKTFEGDKKITECWFLPVENYLQPLYSKIICKSVSPANFRVNSLAETYKELDYTYTTYYDYSFSTAKTVTLNGTKEDTTTVHVGDTANTLFDVASLDIAVRASKLSASLSQVVSLYTPASGAETFGFSGTDLALGSEEKQLRALLDANGLHNTEYLKNDKGEFVLDESGNKTEKPLSTVAVNVLYGGTLSGVSQTYWFAAIENAANNTGRATMLKLNSPIPYALGALVYTLESVEDTIY